MGLILGWISHTEFFSGQGHPVNRHSHEDCKKANHARSKQRAWHPTRKSCLVWLLLKRYLPVKLLDQNDFGRVGQTRRYLLASVRGLKFPGDGQGSAGGVGLDPGNGNAVTAGGLDPAADAEDHVPGK